MSRTKPPRSRWRRFAYENALLLVIGLLVVLAIGGQTITGWHVYNEELRHLGRAELPLGAYVSSGHWLEAMALFVLLSVWLRQNGSTESKKLYGDEEVDRDGDPARPGAPWPVRRGGLVLRLYRNSLTIVLFALFALSVWLHAVGGAEVESIERAAHGEPAVSTLAYLASSRFWFESMQNWQSEFVSIVAIVGLSIFLRQQGSPQSKPVDASHAETGC